MTFSDNVIVASGAHFSTGMMPSAEVLLVAGAFILACTLKILQNYLSILRTTTACIAGMVPLSKSAGPAGAVKLGLLPFLSEAGPSVKALAFCIAGPILRQIINNVAILLIYTSVAVACALAAGYQRSRSGWRIQQTGTLHT